jgi:hypothetical protein
MNCYTDCETENGASAFSSTSCASLDLLVLAVRNCPEEIINSLMEKAWTEGAERLMKLVCQTRDPRDGKGERDVAFFMLAWLKREKPLTYALNIARIASEYGRFEDLLDMANRSASSTNQVELEIFASQLRSDLEILSLDQAQQDSKVRAISLAGKWAPRQQSHYKDLVRPLARLLFPNETAKFEERYRKEVIGPLSMKLAILESLMCGKRWSEINFEHVPAQAMRIYGRDHVTKHGSKEKEQIPGAFLRHDEERFRQYRGSVKAGQAKINTTGTQPHQLVKSYIEHTLIDEQIELMWSAMIEKLVQSGSLGSSMSIVDVSRSMYGEPMEVAIALGLMSSSLSQPPFKDNVITFNTTPQLFNVGSSTTLFDKVNRLKVAPWGGSTNFEASLDLILNMAQLANVESANMVKTLFVFTDMQFNQASSGTSEDTIYQVCRAKFAKAGYKLPNIVFWNLRAGKTKAFPVQVSQYGTAMVSGFSSDLLKVFMSDVEFTPLNILSELLKKYQVSVHPTEI